MRMDVPAARQPDEVSSRPVRIMMGPVALEGEWCQPPGAMGIVHFAHGSGRGRHSPRNQAVARALQRSGTVTLLFDLLTRHEEALEARTGHLRFDIGRKSRAWRKDGFSGTCKPGDPARNDGK